MVNQAAFRTLWEGKNPATGQRRLEERLDTVRKGEVVPNC